MEALKFTSGLMAGAGIGGVGRAEAIVGGLLSTIVWETHPAVSITAPTIVKAKRKFFIGLTLLTTIVLEIASCSSL